MFGVAATVTLTQSMTGVSMQVGDLVRLTNAYSTSLSELLGVILSIDDSVNSCYEITWTDGDLTWEFGIDLEVVCK